MTDLKLFEKPDLGFPVRKVKKKDKKKNQPLNLLNTDLLNDARPTEVIDGKWFIFKDYVFNTKDNLMKIVNYDFADYQKLMILPEIRPDFEANWYQILDNIRDRILLFISLYKSYLEFGNDYPSVGFKKFRKFLVRMNVLSKKSSDQNLDTKWLKRQVSKIKNRSNINF